EQQIAREQLQKMVHYAENGACRRRELLRYFGETYAEESCGGCDNCNAPRDTYDGTVAAQKFLSCVYRIRQQSGFDFGFNQVAEVLTGADTENVRKWNHQKVSTYGIGTEHSRPEWKTIGRELVRMGFLEQREDKFAVLKLTPQGMAVLKERKPVALTRSMTATEPQKQQAGAIACDEELFERLRSLRKQLADERGVPPYIVFSDVTLRLMAREYPSTSSQFAGLSGVGERKLQEFGAVFLKAIADHLGSNPRQIFADESFVVPARARLGNTARETLRRFTSGETVQQIAGDRSRAESTIISHLAEAIEAGEELDLSQFLSKPELDEIQAVFRHVGAAALSPVFDALKGKYDYGRLKLARAELVRRERAATNA
ncbi:MAG TPA: RQC domain-containing protein, partial [Candidatus Dormibacteraeota bacterium]|nr:RQC domain-containing protein [Candidatus Dormibacteraeota bacterium]